jgi:hypothetical protein
MAAAAPPPAAAAAGAAPLPPAGRRSFSEPALESPSAGGGSLRGGAFGGAAGAREPGLAWDLHFMARRMAMEGSAHGNQQAARWAEGGGCVTAVVTRGQGRPRE